MNRDVSTARFEEHRITGTMTPPGTYDVAIMFEVSILLATAESIRKRVAQVYVFSVNPYKLLLAPYVRLGMGTPTIPSLEECSLQLL